jgi:hypothetical protein
MHHYWFPAKKYGYGWGFPVTWQGWVVLLVYLGIILFVTTFYPPVPGNILLFILGVSIPTVILIVVCYLTGEKPRWRWGDRQ